MSDVSSEDDEHVAAMKAQARALKRDLQLAKSGADGLGADSDGEDDDPEKNRMRERLWGAGRGNYYGTDAAEGTDDEEAEEREARRLQSSAAASLSAGDYGFNGDEDEEGDDEEEEDGEDVGERALGRRAYVKGSGTTAVEAQHIDRDAQLARLSDPEKRAVVLKDAPEMTAMAAELSSALREVRMRITPVLDLVKAGQLGTEGGISYLEAKHLLLLSYCQHLVFFMLAKAEGVSVQVHPVVARLVEIRQFLERMRPIDKKLQYQIDKLLAAAERAGDLGLTGGSGAKDQDVGGEDEDEEDLALRPNPAAMLLASASAARAAREGDSDSDDPRVGDDGLYRAPRRVEMAMPEDMARGRRAREERAAADRRRQAQRSEWYKELESEVLGAPQEIAEGDRLAGSDSAFALRERQKLAAREKVEEELMNRIALSKEDKRRLKAAQHSGVRGTDLAEHLADDVAGMMEMAEGLKGALSTKQSKSKGASSAGVPEGGTTTTGLLRQKLAQKYGGTSGSGESKKARSGDADLAPRVPLGDRRAALDRKRAYEDARGDIADEETPQHNKRKRTGEEDEFYRSVRVEKEAKKAAKKEEEQAKRRAKERTAHPPLEEPQTRGARAVTKEILKNRGLTPYRRKDQKNPRVKNRMKYENAVVRHKGAVPSMRDTTVPYGGEDTGIKANITKSRKIKS